jgi:hypothetical protein
MNRLFPAVLVAALGLAAARVPAATAAAPAASLSRVQSDELVSSYVHLVKDFYQKVDPQAALTGAHDALLAYL